jgi:hypothetical protein
MNHPIKRFKADDLDRYRTNKTAKYDLYAGSTSTVLPESLSSSDGLKGEAWKDESKNSSGKEIKSESEGDKNSNIESLFTNEGLQPSYADLNKIFDNSDDNSNDDHVSMTINIFMA